MRKLFTALLTAALFSVPALATIIHVPGDYPTIQAGINAAVNRDTVLVADGVYSGVGNRDIDYLGKAILVTSENGPGTCIIDCSGLEPYVGFFFHQGEDSTSILDGITIMNANSSGIYCTTGSSPLITNCIIMNCHPGIKLYTQSAPIIDNCFIYQNQGSFGGGISCWSGTPTIRNSYIVGNMAGYGAGIYVFGSSGHPIVENCMILNNLADPLSSGGGAGIYCESGSADVRYCIIKGNTAGGRGGGIAWEYVAQDMNIEYCAIVDNRAGWDGAGISITPSGNMQANIHNCTIAGNSTLGDGAGIYCSGNVDLDMSNSIVWGNEEDQIYSQAGALLDINYCDIEGGWAAGIGNFDANPLFVLSEQGDCRIQWGSPCIDSGNPSGPIDPDGTIADLGYLYYDQSIPIRILLSPHDYPIVLEPTGGSFEYTISLTNIDAAVQAVEVWCDAYLPDGSVYGPVFGPVTVDVDSGMCLSRTRVQNVPAGAPQGVFYYNGYAAAGADSSTDTFPFGKLGGAVIESMDGWANYGESFAQFTNKDGDTISSKSASGFFSAYPNPFNPKTAISYQLQAASYVELVVYDIQGREVAKLVDDYRPAGTYEAVFNASGLSNGVYFVRLTAGNYQQTQKLLLVK